jgi:hypothetical protein
MLKDFYVIGVMSNPRRFKIRAKLALQTEQQFIKAGVNYRIIEAAFGERPHEITTAGHPNHIQVRCDHELWLKENLINLAVQQLPSDWKYVMWCDMDLTHLRPDWAEATWQMLQHHPVVQTWSHAVDMGPQTESLTNNVSTGFAYCYQQGMKLGERYGQYFHPGYSWAWRREAWDAVGGMIELGICGAGDDHMAKSLIGQGDRSLPPGIHPNYTHMVKSWENRAVRAIKHDIGFVPGTIIHHYHGKKANRNYWGRWDILKKNEYDPYTHVTKDSRGLLQLDDTQWALRDGLRNYFQSRQEDDLVV